MAHLSGTVDRIVFHNPDTGFVVARFVTAGAARAMSDTTIVGTIPGVRPGQLLRVTGSWETHPVHGRNFRVEAFEQELPTSAEGIERYLASGSVRGIGPVTAGRIVEYFGDETLQVLDTDPEQLLQVPGISERRLGIIKESWNENQRIRDLMIFLQSHDLNPGIAPRVFAVYGDESIAVITHDPFALAHTVRGIGFRTADEIARKLGISRHSPSRFVAGLRYALSEASDDGHVYLPKARLLEDGSRILDVPQAELEPALLELVRRDDAVLEADRVYLAPFYTAESGIARHLGRIAETVSSLTLDPRFDAHSSIEEAEAEQGLQLADLQRRAAIVALTSKVSILTGGPGTGKTSTLRTLIAALDRAEVTYAICAPTGRAAKRAAETTGRPASTIHRLLEFQPSDSTFLYDHDRPLSVDFVIVDEVSMLDTLLFYHLLKAVPGEAHVLLVGDKDQLPAVGAGNVLGDLIESGRVPTVTLTQLFRQAAGSTVVVAAHQINQGTVPEIRNAPDDDLFFAHAADDTRALGTIKRLLVERIPQRYGLDPIDDVQVISPMHRGEVGVMNLNAELQILLNPPAPGKAELTRGEKAYRMGDKVMQIRNNYEKDVYNGDTGRIVQIDVPNNQVTVSFPSALGPNEVEYSVLDLDELTLAYAVSVHKAQGSEFPAVVMPLVTRHYTLLQRNLLYTAVTRARQLCVLVGSRRALEIAVQTDHHRRRFTALSERLQSIAAIPSIP